MALAVADQLHFDMASARNELLQKDIGDTEGSAGLAVRLVERLVELLRPVGHAHPAATAAHRCLNDDRIANLRRQRLRLGVVAHRGIAAGDDRHLCLVRDVASDDLIAELIEDFRFGTDEDHPRFGTGASKMSVFGEEAVAGMDGVNLVLPGEADDGIDVEIRLDRLAGPADTIRLIGLEAMQSVAVLVRVNRDCANPQFVSGAEDTNGDFTAIGDEQFANGFDGLFRHVS